MTAESEQTTGLDVKRPIILSPWLVALAALGLYGLTLNHWVTFASLPFAAQITGWDWHPGPLAWRPNPQYPLFLVLTYPLRWLPLTWRPLGLNVFAAVCAATVLAALARSVRLVCQVASNAERPWENREQPLLSDGVPFIPALFAVLLLAAQRTFWENAVSGTGEMIDLAVFALLVLFLLEFRASRQENWLNLLALVYGLGLANNWALIGYFPCFLLAAIWMIWRDRVVPCHAEAEAGGGEGEMIWQWIRRLVSRNGRFAGRILGFASMGLLLYGLIPLFGAAHGDGGFWELLRAKLGEQHFFLTRIPRYFALIASMMTLVPLLFAAINLPGGEGDTTRGAGFTRLLVRGVNLLCLAVGILMFLDIKWSPNPRGMGFGVVPGTAGFLTFYYLAALSVGFFSGRLLLVFRAVWKQTGDGGGTPDGPDRNAYGGEAQLRDWERKRRLVRLASGAMVGLLSATAVGLPAVLLCRNWAEIRRASGPVAAEFGNEMARSIPDNPTIVLADDPSRLYLALGACQNLHLRDQYLFVESTSLVHRVYICWLAEHYSVFSREITNRDQLPERLNDQQAGELVAQLVRHYPVFYLHPSFGSHLERVCMTPHRLGAVLHLNPTNLLETLSLSPGALETNQVFWHTRTKESLAGLPELARTSADARRVAGYYSQILDYWGTELQKAGTRRKLPPLLEDANAQFVNAIILNPTNLIARANQQYNARLLGSQPVGPPAAASNAVAQWDGRWDQALRSCGPADVPRLDIEIGRYFAQHGSYRQAAILFQRSLELSPDNPTAELDLANSYVDLGLPDAAFALIADAQKRAPSENSMDVAGLAALAYAAKNEFAQADKLLADTHARNPRDDRFTVEMAEIYRLIGYRAMDEGKGAPTNGQVAHEAAAVWFKKALVAFNEHLQFLCARPIPTQDTNLVGLRIAEMQKMITNN